jgi:hypothetical protein
MRDRVLNYFAKTFNHTQSQKILIYDTYSENILISHHILCRGTYSEFQNKYNIITCEHIDKITSKNIPCDVIYVLEKSSMVNLVNKNIHQGQIYVNYFIEDSPPNNMPLSQHIILDKFQILGNIIILENNITFSEIMTLIDLPFVINYEEDIQDIPNIITIDTNNTLTMIKRENNLLPTLQFKYRLIDYIFDFIIHNNMNDIISNPTANALLMSIWFEPLNSAYDSLKNKFLQFKKDNDLAKFEQQEIDVREFNKNTTSALTKNINTYNESKIAYKLLFELITTCVKSCNESFEDKLAVIDTTRDWQQIYLDIKPIVQSMQERSINSEFYKLFHLMHYHGQNWNKLVVKLMTKHKVYIDRNKLPANISYCQSKNTFCVKGVRNSLFPRSMKCYKSPRFGIIHSVKLFHVDKSLTSHDIINNDIYYIGTI